MRFRVWTVTFLVIGALAPAAGAAEPMAVSNAWARVTAAASLPAVVYLTVKDTGAADRLIAVSSPIARQATLHQSRMANGVMLMDPVATLPLAAGATLKLAPGGYHIMLEGLAQPLAAGQHFPLTLTFAKAEPVTVSVTVEPMSFTPPDLSADGDDDDDDDDDTGSGTMSGMKM